MSPDREAGNGPRVDCSCGRVFRVPRSLGGGLANCPSCGQVNEVPSIGVEWLFVLGVGFGAFVVLAAAFGAWQAGGLLVGLGTLAVGGAILAGVVAAL